VSAVEELTQPRRLALFNMPDIQTDGSLQVLCSVHHKPRSWWTEVSAEMEEWSEANHHAFITH